ncbi:MAG TPA: DUF3168 domain-containing protein [Allosphingosinicella sp.]|jgi:hypothetical protein
MSDPSYAIQKAVYDALIAAGAANSRVYHRVPDGAPLPYVHIGQDQIFAAYEAGEFSECHVVVHGFAETMPGLKLLVGTIRDALDKPLTLVGFDCHEATYESTRYMTDSSGLTEHAVVEFVYMVQPKP